jgi:hypothetical protein
MQFNASEFLQLGENTSILIAITVCQGIGMMECWNNGTLGNKNGKDHL